MRWIGIDYGAARVGLAVSDDEGRFAVPRATVPAADAIEEILQLADDDQTLRCVIGLPLELDGRAGRSAQAVERFVEKLEEEAANSGLQIKVAWQDERLTTGLAKSLLDEAGVHGKRRKGVLDQVAAVQILQSHLDSQERYEHEEH